MNEFDFERGLEALRLRETDGSFMAKQLRGFIEQRQKEDAARHDYKLDKMLHLIKPECLENGGVRQTFLIAWNPNFGSVSGETRNPITIWLARGKESGEVGVNRALLVDYVNVGTIDYKSMKFEPSSDTEVYLGRIPLQSSVIIDPLRDF